MTRHAMTRHAMTRHVMTRHATAHATTVTTPVTTHATTPVGLSERTRHRMSYSLTQRSAPRSVRAKSTPGVVCAHSELAWWIGGGCG